MSYPLNKLEEVLTSSPLNPSSAGLLYFVQSSHVLRDTEAEMLSVQT